MPGLTYSNELISRDEVRPSHKKYSVQFNESDWPQVLHFLLCSILVFVPHTSFDCVNIRASCFGSFIPSVHKWCFEHGLRFHGVESLFQCYTLF